MNNELINKIEDILPMDKISHRELDDVNKVITSGKLVIPTNVLEEIFHTICPHQQAYNEGEYRQQDKNFKWQPCRDCILRDIILNADDGVVQRDICFWIWHNDLFD